MEKKQKLIIIGAGETAEMAYEYFTYDSDYQVEAFCVEEKFMDKTSLFGLPIIPFEQIEQYYSSSQYMLFVAAGYGQLNRVRKKLYLACKAKEYKIASYLSSRAFIWRDVVIGENCFILENNTVQYKVSIGNNVIMWSGNHIGHRSVIGNHCFLSSQVVVSGYCNIGEHCFLGVNSCIADNVSIAEDCVIGAGALILSDTEKRQVYCGNAAIAAKFNSYVIFNVKEK